MRTLLTGDLKPEAGDLVLAAVHELGKHRRVERVNGRRALMLPGDEIIVCYGNRYAPDQFEALIGNDLGLCDLVASGGIASREVSRHERMLPPTQIMPIGLIGDAQGERLNLARYRIRFQRPRKPIQVLLVLGTAMNSGKTFTAASLVRGLKEDGFRVAGIKATGTGSGGDLWKMKDMGADVVLDFTDAGFASTYKASDDAIAEGVCGLINHAARRRCDIAIVEIADGLQHAETATLVRSPELKSLVSGVVFAAYDSLGARAGYEELRQLDYRVLAISGQVTRSPLAAREAAAATGCALYSPFEIQAGALVPAIAGVRDAGALDSIEDRVRRRMANPAGFVVGFGSPQGAALRLRQVEDLHGFDFPEDLGETA